MNTKHITSIGFLLLMFLSACFKEEDALSLPQIDGNMRIAQTAESIYHYQLYYDMHSNTMLSSHKNTAWDIGFACEAEGWHIVLNASKMTQAANTNSTDFDGITSVGAWPMLFDNPNGQTDSLAIADWLREEGGQMLPTGYVYVIDMGIDEQAQPLGYKKVVFGLDSDGAYTLRYANLDGSEAHSLSIAKDPTLNHVSFSFAKGVVPIEPPKTDWTLLLGSYQTMLPVGDGTYIPYFVRGVLLNPYKVRAALDTTITFEAVHLSDTAQLIPQAKGDIIGHNWKYYDFATSSYTIVKNKAYIVREQGGYYYKLRFVSFYNMDSEKGYPAFETAVLF